MPTQSPRAISTLRGEIGISEPVVHIINGLGVGIDCVGGDGFIVMVHIQCWVWQAVLPFEVCCRRKSTKLDTRVDRFATPHGGIFVEYGNYRSM